MKIWLVTEQDYEVYTVLGVYSNENAAKDHAEALGWKTMWGDVEIEEYDVLDTFDKM